MKQTILVLCLLTIANASCNKKDECIGGSGGNLTLRLYPQYHGKPIYSTSVNSDTAYIIFNTLEIPSFTSNVHYDLKVAGMVGADHVNVPNLRCGNYVVYLTGYDTSNTHIFFGATSVSTSQKEGYLDVTVPVNE